MEADRLLLLPLWYAAFLLSATCHEAAHAWAAYRGGDSTAYLGGQVTLNPLPHMLREPFGTVLIPLLTFMQSGWMMGWASAPYDPLWEDRHPRRAAAMAAAGPLSNLVLALVAFAALKGGLALGAWVPPHEGLHLDQLVSSPPEGEGRLDGLGRLLSVLLSLNVLLFTFNLIPLPPLDGAGILAGLCAPVRPIRDRLRASPFGALIGLLVAWYCFRWIFTPVYGVVLLALYG